MPNNPNAKDNLKPFEPGAKWKGNRHGRIVKPGSLAAEWQKIWSEILFEQAKDESGKKLFDKSDEPIMRPVIDETTGKTLTRLSARMRAATTSRNVKEFEIALKASGYYNEKLQIIRDEKETITPALIIPAELLAPDFLASHRAVMSEKYTEFVEYGGRGSTKSSFVSLEFIQLLVNHPTIHALATRQVKDTLRGSVYSQLLWAINELGMFEQFNCTVSPMEMTYIPTGQKIYFRGADDPGKIKSIKPPFGYIGLVWFEELDSFYGANTIRNIEQSALRGGDEAWTFKTFNPPPTSQNWANKYILIPKENQWQHKSDYRTVPPEWLGRVFLDEAEHLKTVNLQAYEHEYLGLPTSNSGMVFDNLQIKSITDEQIAQFDNVLRGVDWGFAPDPYSYGKMHFDTAQRILYIYDEVRQWKKNEKETYEILVAEHGLQPNDMIICDSSQPGSVADYREFGANARGAEKGADSRKYSYRWLQGLTQIIIDPKRAPYHAQEFTEAEYPRTKDGEVIGEYPTQDDHAIDDVRYATNLIWKQRGL